MKVFLLSALQKGLLRVLHMLKSTYLLRFRCGHKQVEAWLKPQLPCCMKPWSVAKISSWLEWVQEISWDVGVLIMHFNREVTSLRTDSSDGKRSNLWESGAGLHAWLCARRLTRALRGSLTHVSL